MKIFYLVFLLFLAGCFVNRDSDTSVTSNNLSNPDLYLHDDIYIEKKPDSVSLFNYSADNKIYNQFNSFDYSFHYIKNADTSFFSIKKNSNEGYDWEFVSKNGISDSTILKVRLTPKPFDDTFDPNYEQTIIQYDYIGKDNMIIVGGERTGCIENYKNIWLHPPREFLFRILELNPFPFIQAPYRIGNKWGGQLTIGSYWSDPRWLVWDKSITNHYSYEITDRVDLETEIGKIDCLVVKAKATSRLGNTFLTSWFHPDEGFIKMEYNNIDESKIIFDKKWL